MGAGKRERDVQDRQRESRLMRFRCYLCAGYQNNASGATYVLSARTNTAQATKRFLQ